jgi:tetratricopeptide (TPR) repeat protein
MKIFLVLIILFTLIYICPPTVTIGDVAELTGSACSLGIAHSPGYPLFCNFYKIFSFLIPFGDYGYRTAITSVVLFVSSAVICYLLFKNLLTSELLAIFCFIYFISQEVLIRQSIVGEVFALHNFIFVTILFFMLYDKISFNKKLYIVSLLTGLAFGNQHIIIFVLPSIFLWFFYNIFVEQQKVTVKNILYSVLFFIIGFAIYVYVPIRSLRQPLYDWEDPETLDRFIYLFTRGRYGTFSLAQGGKLVVSIENLYTSLKLFIHIIGIRNLILFLFSLIVLFLNLKKLFDNKKIINFLIVTSLTMFFSGPVIIMLSGLKSITSSNIYLLERLVTTSIVSIVLFVTASLFVIHNLNFVTVFLVAVNIFLFYDSIVQNSLRNNFFLYDYTYNIFRNTPYNSILFSDRADESEFSIAYYQRLKNVRKDINFVDCNASVTRSIYGDDYYKIWGEPRLKIRTKVEQQIVNTSIPKVFYNTVLPQQTGIQKFKFGLLYSTSFIPTVIPYELFLIRNIPDKNLPREFALYLTQLNLLAEYYINIAKNNDQFFDFAKRCYTEMFLLTSDARYLSFLGYYYFTKNMFDLAKEVYQNILNYPTEKSVYVETLVNLGVVYERLNDFQQAEECFYKAINFDPSFAQAYYNLGSLYFRINKKQQAIKMFEQYLKLNSSDERIKGYIEVYKKE